MATLFTTQFYVDLFNTSLNEGAGDAPTLQLWDRDRNLLAVFKLDSHVAFSPVGEDGKSSANLAEDVSEGLRDGVAVIYTLNDKGGECVIEEWWREPVHVRRGQSVPIQRFEISGTYGQGAAL